MKFRVWIPGYLGLLTVLGAAGAGCAGPSSAAAQEWHSVNRYRVLLSVDPRGVTRSHSPTGPLRIDFQQALANQGGAGTFDEHTIEVVAYTSSGQPVVFDAARSAYDRYLLPRRIDRYYGIEAVDLVFVMPDHMLTHYAVCFDTVESGRGRPDRYPGLVGDGDFFSEGYKRREIAACHFDAFCDLDGDGDLDLFKGGVEPYIYCYANVGGNRFVPRGRLTSGGELFALPHELGNGRAWMTVAFHDWDGDGDQDLFPSFQDGPDSAHVVFYRNTTAENGGQVTFTRVGRMYTDPDPPASPEPLGGGPGQSGWFPAMTFVEDWDQDGDGRTDVLVTRINRVYLHRNLGPDGAGGFRLANGVLLQANGQNIDLPNPRVDCADIDGDGDWDLFAGTQPGAIHLFENVATQGTPVFAQSQIIALSENYLISDAHSGVKVADFTGDGRLDFVVGRFWERVSTDDPGEPRDYGRLYENVGTPQSPAFERRWADGGAPYTERFQPCDAIRQNCVRAVNWDNAGGTDLLAGDTDGYLWYFRNEGTARFPLFATGEKLRLAGGALLSLASSGGHARPDVTDWNNDGRKDLLVADGGGWVTWFENVGTDADPALATGQRVYANGSPIDRGGRSSVLVCDWNNDGKKDVIFADADDGYVFFRNAGTDANPVLAAAQPLGLSFYTRPNLGSFVDWDGDGRRDFIGCNFENNIRFYRNNGSGQPGDLPQFPLPDGQAIIEPYTVMLTSGADAVDFNSDGDLDILTGQGHGGGHLRFFDRNDIDDTLNGTLPVVTVGGWTLTALGDFDGDDDVDQADFGYLQMCLSGSGVLPPPGCHQADMDGDLDVDTGDAAVFLACMNGAGHPPGC